MDTREEDKIQIYFCGSIRGGTQDIPIYVKIVEVLERKGTVLTEHIKDAKRTEEMDKNLSDRQIYEMDMRFLDKAAVLVAEVTQPSLGVGFEIARALDKGKPVLCLYRDKGEPDQRKCSALIAGCPDLEYHVYRTVEEAKSFIDAFFVKIKTS